MSRSSDKSAPRGEETAGNTTPRPEAKKKEPSGIFWPLFIIGLLATNVLGAVALVLFALDDPSHHIEKDYYKKAVNYDKEMAQQRQNLRLGWKLRIDFEAPDTARRAFLKKRHMIPETVLKASLVDRQGTPLGEAKVAVEAFPFRRAARRVKATLKPLEGGGYGARLKLLPSGRWRFLLSAERGGERFTATIDRDVPSALALGS